MKITVKQLVELKACEGQVKTFKKLFGASATVTSANCLKACKAGLNFNWASRLLSPKALKVYEKVKAPASKAYEKVRAPALKVYEEVKAPALKAYQEATAPALKAYQEAMAQAGKAHRKAMAIAFYEAVNG